MRFRAIFCAVAALLVSVPVSAGGLGAAFDVAPGTKDTRSQTWASAAWSEAANCWLVVWREGYLNEKLCDIWCARVSADGTAMDPEGILLTSGKEMRDRPRIASDGKDFLVIWEDFANGRDWDVYAVRVSGAGKAIDKAPVLVAGGAHNQCRPEVRFAGDGYCVLWMGFADGKYGVYGTRLSPGSPLIGAKAVNVAVLKGPSDKDSHIMQAQMPVMAANAAGDVLAAFYVTTGFVQGGTRHQVRVAIDPATGGPAGEPTRRPKRSSQEHPGMWGWYRERRASLAMGSDGAVTVGAAHTRNKSKNEISVCRLSKTGDVLDLQELGSTFLSDRRFKPIQSRTALTFDGKTYLVLTDGLHPLNKKQYPEYRARIVGWRITPDGKAKDANGFLVAGDGDLDCMLPAVAAGSEGACLVVYSEVRGVDDIKVLARVVK